MALSRMIIRKVSTSAVPLSLSAIGFFPTTLNQAIFASQSALNQSHTYSSSASDKDAVDTNLHDILEQEIKFEESKINNFKVLPKSYSFPFKIEAYLSVLCLKREYPDDDERVSITIRMSDVNTIRIGSNNKILCDDDSTEDNDTATDGSMKNKSYKDDNEIPEQDIRAPPIPIPMVIEVEKGGYVKSLEFEITMSTDGINIKKIFITNKENDYDVYKYTGPQLEGSLYKLQPHIHKYLEIRGIDNNMANSLLKIIAKENKMHDLRILTSLKKALEK